MHFFNTPPFLHTLQPSLAVIGNFDGMHKGHQAMLTTLQHWAKEKNLKTTVILFEPQPREFFNRDAAPSRLQTCSDKLIFLKKIGIDQVICIRFDQVFADYPPEYFIETFLLKTLVVRGLLVGKDFCFGRNRSGDIHLLTHYQSKGLLDVRVMPTITVGTERVSSTSVRETLAAGDFKQAAELLGRDYSMCGKVIYGAGRGRLLDFPTANIPVKRYRSPLHGVYAAHIAINPSTTINGIVNIGYRPTVTCTTNFFLEAFLFTDDNINLYGQRITVIFRAKVRDEQKFNSLEHLKNQIQRDVAYVKSILD